MARSPKEQPGRHEDDSAQSPTAWFLMLERAIRGRDRGLEEVARRELARLGVSVWVDEAVLLDPRKQLTLEA